MLIKRSPNGIDLPYSSEITPRAVFESRRSFIRQLAVGSIAGGALLEMAGREAFAQSGQKLAAKPNTSFVVMDKQTPFKDASTYNNYYEFGTDKSDPARNAGTLKTRPWEIAIGGEVGKPMTIGIEQRESASTGIDNKNRQVAGLQVLRNGDRHGVGRAVAPDRGHSGAGRLDPLAILRIAEGHVLVGGSKGHLAGIGHPIDHGGSDGD